MLPGPSAEQNQPCLLFWGPHCSQGAQFCRSCPPVGHASRGLPPESLMQGNRDTWGPDLCLLNPIHGGPLLSCSVLCARGHCTEPVPLCPEGRRRGRCPQYSTNKIPQKPPVGRSAQSIKPLPDLHPANVPSQTTRVKGRSVYCISPPS